MDAFNSVPPPPAQYRYHYLYGGALLFAVIFIAVVVVSGYALYRMDRGGQQIESLYRQQTDMTQLVIRMRNIGLDRVFVILKMVASNDLFEQEELRTRYGYLASDFIVLRDQLRGQNLTPLQLDAVASLLRTIREVSANQDYALKLLQMHGDQEMLRPIIHQAVADQYQLTTSYNHLLEIIQRNASAVQYNMSIQNRSVVFTATVVAGISFPLILIGTLSLLLRMHQTTRALAEANSTLEQSAVQLESKVRERTLELEQTNCELQQTILDRRTAQEQLIQAEKMASLGNLVAGISHEINTPVGVGLTAVTSLAEEVVKMQQLFATNGLRKSDFQHFIDHAAQACAILEGNLSRASDLIRSFKQVAVDQGSEEWRTIHLHAYFEEILLSLRPKLKRRPIEVHNEADPDLLIFTHPGAIYQIVSNLILNSLTHAFHEEQSGTITLRAVEQGGQIGIDYTDNGSGIPAPNLAHIFDPFFTTRRGSGGSGLGLNIVYNLVTNSLKGTIEVQSQPNQFTTFQIKIPNRITQRSARDESR